MPAKPHLNLVFIGHVDHGKSTTVGRILYDTGNIDPHELENLKKLAEQMGKATFEFAFVMDQVKEERERGLTIDVAHKRFDTDKYYFTIIDAPGHRDFVKNMITGTSQADAAVLVVGGAEGVQTQTKEHIFLARTLGVEQLIVAINKMDATKPPYSEARFNELKTELTGLLRGVGYKVDRVPFIPISSYKGENIVKASSKMPWYKGPSLVESLNQLTVPPKPTNLPLRLPVQDVYSITGAGTVPVGRVAMPRTLSPKSPRFKARVAEALAQLDPPRPDRPPRRRTAAADDPELAALRAALRAHPVHACPDRPDHERWMQRHEQLAKELVEAGLWHGAGDRCKSQMCPAGRPRDGFRIHDFLEHNESSDERESERDKERKRKAAWRARKRAEQEQEDGPAGTGMGHDGTVPPHRSIREVSEKEDQRPPDGGLPPNSGGVLVPQRSARAAQAALGVIERLKASVDSGRRSWSFSEAVKAEWDALLDDDGNLSTARDFLVWFVAEMTGRKPDELDWQMAMQKVKRWRARALYGVEQTVTRGLEGRPFWIYVEAVCRQAQARSEGST